MEDKDRAAEKLSAQYAAYQSFLNILKMASPFVPHITEEMYHANVVKKGDAENARESIESQSDHGYFYDNENAKSVHSTRWPIGSKRLEGELAEGAKLALLVVSEARKVKTAKKIRFGVNVSMLQIKCPSDKQGILKPFLRDISSLVKARETVVIDSDSVEVSIEE